jgi:hypothetical protein
MLRHEHAVRGLDHILYSNRAALKQEEISPCEGSCPIFFLVNDIFGGHAVTQLVEALCCKLEGRGFDSP